MTLRVTFIVSHSATCYYFPLLSSCYTLFLLCLCICSSSSFYPRSPACHKSFLMGGTLRRSRSTASSLHPSLCFKSTRISLHSHKPFLLSLKCLSSSLLAAFRKFSLHSLDYQSLSTLSCGISLLSASLSSMIQSVIVS